MEFLLQILIDYRKKSGYTLQGPHSLDTFHSCLATITPSMPAHQDILRRGITDMRYEETLQAQPRVTTGDCSFRLQEEQRLNRHAAQVSDPS
jgi:hypothetical protein